MNNIEKFLRIGTEYDGIYGVTVVISQMVSVVRNVFVNEVENQGKK